MKNVKCACDKYLLLSLLFLFCASLTSSCTFERDPDKHDVLVSYVRLQEENSRELLLTINDKREVLLLIDSARIDWRLYFQEQCLGLQIHPKPVSYEISIQGKNDVSLYLVSADGYILRHILSNDKQKKLANILSKANGNKN